MVCAVIVEHPERLWWLLALPLLWWLAQPPRPSVVHWTPHLPEVQKALAALRRRPPRRSTLRLVCSLAAAAAVVLAYAGLATQGVPGPQRLVVLLDASASMAASAAGRPSAFAAAQERLRAQLAVVPEHVDVTVLRCGGPLLRRHGAHARAARDLGGPAGGLAAPLADVAERLPADTAVWTLTDGQGQARLPARGALTVFDVAGPNAAVLAARLTDGWPLPQLEVAVDLIAFAAGPNAVVVRAGGDAVEPTERTLTLSPGVATTLTLPLLRRAAGGELVVAVELAGDVLAADDRWSCRLPALPAPTIAVLADAEAGPYAHVAAAALAAEVGGRVAPAEGAPTAGLLVVDGGEVAIEPGRVRALCFGSRLAGVPRGPVWLEPRIVDWDRRQPWLQDLDLSLLRIAVALPETLPAGQPFLWGEAPSGERAPLAVTAGGPERRSVHFAFRLADGNLPLLPAFPQLLRRAFVHAHAEAAAPTGQRAPLAVGEQDLLRRPAAADRTLPAFGAPPTSVAGALLLAALALLALRAWLR